MLGCISSSLTGQRKNVMQYMYLFFVFYIFVRDSGIFQGLIFPQTE